MSQEECAICLEVVKSKKVQCPYCMCIAHSECTKKHLLNEFQEPCCFNCNKQWSREVLDSQPLAKSWLGKELREHRAETIFQRERAMFPATVALVATRANLDILRNEIERLRTLLTEANENEWYAEAVQNRNAVTREHAEECIRLSEAAGVRHRIRFLCDCLRSMEVGQSVVEGRDTSAQTQRTIDQHEREYVFRSSSETATIKTDISKDKEKDQPKILFGCPVDGCNGFIGSYNSKCLVCETLACRSCRELITKTVDVTPEAVREAVEKHVCDPGTLSTLALVASDSKKCPKCRVDILRTEGCPVMLCTQCGTFFSWTTGKELRGKPHNPHYDEYRQRQIAKNKSNILPNGVTPAQGDANNLYACAGRVPHKDSVIARLEKMGVPIKCPRQLGLAACRIIDLVRHIQDREILPLTEPQELNLKARLNFVRNEMPVEKFKRTIQISDKCQSLLFERNQVWEMFCAEVIHGLQNNILKKEATVADAITFLTGLNGLIDYVNKAMIAIGKRYNHLPHVICESSTNGHYIYTNLPQSYVFQVRKQVTSNITVPEDTETIIPDLKKSVFGDAMTFIGTLKSMVSDAAAAAASKSISALPKVPTDTSNEQLYKRPRIHDSSDEQSDSSEHSE